MVNSKWTARVTGALAGCQADTHGHALGGPNYVTNSPVAASIGLVQNRRAMPFIVSPDDWPGVIRAMGDLSDNVKLVTNLQPDVLKNHSSCLIPDAVLIGTIEKSREKGHE
jgi:hypothetical protein